MLCVSARTALDGFTLDVDFEVQRGSCLALAGPSGAGKSTILRVIAGIARPDHGRVLLDDRTWLDTTARIDLPPEARRVGYVFQHYALFDHLSAWQNVAYPLRGMGAAERRSRAIALLDRFGIAALADARPERLSGGERQRVAVARALAREPDALLLDEPLSALDARTRSGAARELLHTLAEADVPSILVTHDFTEAALLGDSVAIIDAGRVIQRGAPEQLAAAPASAFVADFAGAVVLTGTAAPGEAGLTVVDLDGGGRLTSVDGAAGPVAVAVFPWEITLVVGPPRASGSAQNGITARITSLTAIGNRVRVGLEAGQPFVAEITSASVEGLGLVVGGEVTAAFKATATRLVPR
ncbi:MAG: ATP-binding cassette domain-containing protein [Solirubrobacteraceae bacterium]|nr:ATP-binding cassette domain-containing protein [Solirubrobacteraceae bacterium]